MRLGDGQVEQRLDATHQADDRDHQDEHAEERGDDAEHQRPGGEDGLGRGLIANRADQAHQGVGGVAGPVRIGERVPRHERGD